MKIENQICKLKHKMVSFNELREFCESNPRNDYIQAFNNCIKSTSDNDYVLFDNMKVSVNENATPEILTHLYTVSGTTCPIEHLNDLIHVLNECISTYNVNNLIKIADKFEPCMDNNNKEAYNVLKNKGIDAAVEHMFKDPTNPNRTLSYSEMRYYYG